MTGAVEIEIDPLYRHAIWICPGCSGHGSVEKGMLIVAVCGMLTRFGGFSLRKCPECLALMTMGQNKVCHFCAKSA